MIVKEQKYGVTPGVTVVYFGTGTIKAAIGDNITSTDLLLKQDKPHEMGIVEKPMFNAADFKPEVVLSFKTKEEVNIMISMLYRLSKHLQK